MSQLPKVWVKGKGYKIEGNFHRIEPNQPIWKDGKLCGVTNPRQMTYIHSYGSEYQFFAGLAESKLHATRCDNDKCEFKGTVHLPFRIYCPDCLRKATVLDVTQWARDTARIHSYIVTSRTGAFNTLETPIKFIDIEIDGIATILKSYQMAGDPEIGQRVVPIFRTKEPTYTITDLAWVVEGTREHELPEGFTF